MRSTKDSTIIPSGSHLPSVGDNKVKNVSSPSTEEASGILRRLWQALDQSVDPIVITDRSGIIEYVNPGFEILTGYSKN